MTNQSTRAQIWEQMLSRTHPRPALTEYQLGKAAYDSGARMFGGESDDWKRGYIYARDNVLTRVW